MTPLVTSVVMAMLIGGLLAWLSLRALLPWLRQRLPDQPNQRSSHRQPIPRGGGLVFVLLAVIARVLTPEAGAVIPWLPALCLPLALVGLADDRFNLPPGLRYLVQVSTAAALLAVTPLPVPWWLWPLAVVAITAVINFTNFMDGLDGLVAGCSLVLIATATLTLAREGFPPNSLLPLWALTGALTGFLLWNWSPAKVFMGDVGSTFLGALFAGLVLQCRQPLSALGLLLVAAPLLGDALSCVLRRAADRQPITQAHRLHLYQRLQQAGWSHQQVATTYITATAAASAAFLLGGLTALLPVLAIELAAAITLERKVAVPFARNQSPGATIDGQETCRQSR
jgi:UDP-N-acetylmuramyl pentapeptide phosphotransferase/UDP-N-acetylglucosamine-1-phosphate transferase